MYLVQNYAHVKTVNFSQKGRNYKSLHEATATFTVLLTKYSFLHCLSNNHCFV